MSRWRERSEQPTGRMGGGGHTGHQRTGRGELCGWCGRVVWGGCCAGGVGRVLCGWCGRVVWGGCCAGGVWGGVGRVLCGWCVGWCGVDGVGRVLRGGCCGGRVRKQFQLLATVSSLRLMVRVSADSEEQRNEGRCLRRTNTAGSALRTSESRPGEGLCGTRRQEEPELPGSKSEKQQQQSHTSTQCQRPET